MRRYLSKIEKILLVILIKKLLHWSRKFGKKWIAYHVPTVAKP
jgi:hypothetical protein